MPWAGILDEADWYAFREAAGPTDLPERLEELIPNGGQGFPWLGENAREEAAAKVLACTLKERGYSEYEYRERAVVRAVNRTTAFQKTQTFFKIANQSKRGEILYITRS